MRKDIKIVLESIWYLILPVFIKTSRENPRLQSWDERRQVK